MKNTSRTVIKGILRSGAAQVTLAVLVVAGLALPAHADEAVADLVERVSPSVVTIISEQPARPRAASGPHDRRMAPDANPYEEFFRRFGSPDRAPMPRRSPQKGLGAGFVFDQDGLIITNNHVVEGAERVTVRLQDYREFAAEVVGTDPLTDLALLRIETEEELPVVTLGDSDEIRVGEDVVAIGNPFGLSSTVTTGIVSAKGRNISGGPYAEFIQTDAAINRGNSGGPLLNMEGEVIGVNSAIYSPTGGSVGLGFAVTSNIVQTVVADLMDDGEIDRGWLGVSIQPVSAEIAAAMGLDAARGALVADVVEGSPADGTLRPGDVILSFAGQPVDTSADLPRLVGATRSGTASDLGILRDGSERTVSVAVGAYDARTAGVDNAESGGKTLGVTVAPAGEEGGVAVVSVLPDSPAATAGLRPGDVILRLGKVEIDSSAALRDALASEKTDPGLIMIKRDGSRIFLTVRIA